MSSENGNGNGNGKSKKSFRQALTERADNWGVPLDEINGFVQAAITRRKDLTDIAVINGAQLLGAGGIGIATQASRIVSLMGGIVLAELDSEIDEEEVRNRLRDLDRLDPELMEDEDEDSIEDSTGDRTVQAASIHGEPVSQD